MALTRDQVLQEALALTDEVGLDSLSLRTLAARLGVQAPTLYWHVKNKAELLDALSDAIMAEALDSMPDPDGADSWQEWLLGALGGLRRALLEHRDGARIVSGARDSLGRVEFTEVATRRLAREGIDDRRAWLLVLAGARYVLGHVLAEQGDAAPSAVAEDEFRRRFPTVAHQASSYFGSNTPDDLFEDAVRMLVGLPARL